MPGVREVVRGLTDMSLDEVLSTGSIWLTTDTAGVPEGVRAGPSPLFAGDLAIDLLSEFSTEGTALGPHLLRPGRHIEIAPGVLSGEPHVAGTRIETRVIYALRQRRYSLREIVDLYRGDLTVAATQSAIALERQLASNSARLAA